MLGDEDTARTAEGASAPSATSGRSWWLRMTAASAALVALLWGAVFLTPGSATVPGAQP